MKTKKAILIATFLSFACLAMGVNAEVTTWVCKNNKGSQVRFVNDFYNCGNGEQAVELTFYADGFNKLSDIEYGLSGYNSNSYLTCNPSNSYGVTASRVVEKFATTSCPYGYFQTSFGTSESSISAACRNVNGLSGFPYLTVACRLEAKTD